MPAQEADWNTLESLYADSKGNYDEILKFSNGTKYLKLRTISKALRLKQISKKYGIKGLSGLKVNEVLKKVFDTLTEKKIEDFIRQQYNAERLIAKGKENELFSQLKKLVKNDWGGVRFNQLEYHIVNNYVKKINNFDEMKQKIQTEVNKLTEGWTLSNWYSFWSNKLLESQINDHPKVLPGIGEIAHIDFFWDNIPFDLKTTKLAQGFIEEKRAEMQLDYELKTLKTFANSKNIQFDSEGTDSEIKTELISKLSNGKKEYQDFLKKKIFDIRTTILKKAISDPKELAIWNYENQSEKRFGDENRLFLILVDKNTTEDSWKLKREKDFITKKIKNFLDAGPEVNLLKNLAFKYGSKDFNANCCILFIVEE